MENMDYMIEVDGRSVLVEKVVEQKTRDVSDELVDRLVAMRKAAGMTQQDIADIVGLPRANISRLERKLYTPTLGILMKYAGSLGKRISLELEDWESV